ncbi:TrbM/KikA/MpfK family conjugal transfer protein [Escherichia coli]|uniref:TrbM/KikA/MpfK family conjugal transfer protein n=1 Tax=Escherichia coli TaxID=562 RepID=UPI00111B06D7|nr:TrbM/KikA/MpfK family conjugal transfer protein [Escherichia coli]
MTKIKILILAAFVSFGTVHRASAENGSDALSLTGEFLEQPVNSSDPCTVFLCMAGMLKGESPGECSGAKKKFFSIIKRKHGSFHPGRTFNARKAFLGDCPSAPGDIVGKILDKYGKLRW